MLCRYHLNEVQASGTPFLKLALTSIAETLSKGKFQPSVDDQFLKGSELGVM